MKLRKLFAGVAAAATLLGGMAFGATTANAAEANISSTTITVNATDANQFYTKPVDTADLQANLRMFKYVELAMCLMATLALSWRVWSPVRQWMLLSLLLVTTTRPRVIP